MCWIRMISLLNRFSILKYTYEVYNEAKESGEDEEGEEEQVH